ncbi:23S rRNA (uracil(1939)-C(5))-methyltransferase RlmD [Bacteroidota bacterium]
MQSKKEVIVELEIESIGFQGISIARKEGLVYFVKGAVPGDIVNAKVRKKRKKYIETTIIEILKPSEHRIPPKCNYFGVCGGCSWQHLSYDQQIIWKKQHIIDAFTRNVKVDVGYFEDTLASPKVFNYRNKMEFSFGSSRWLTKEEIDSNDNISQKEFALGLHVPGRYDKIIDIQHCHIQNEICNKVLKLIREKALELEVTAYNNHSHEGFLRNLILRTSVENNELMIILVSNDIKSENEQVFLNWFENDFLGLVPEAAVIAHAVNNTLSPVAFGDTRIISGTGYITENILGIDFQISPYSFFQTNSSQLNKFIEEIIKVGEMSNSDMVWDLYCGTGSITLPASKVCKEIIGIELFEGSIKDARKNAELNDITNAEFICADLHEKDISTLLDSLPNPDIIFIDPPRAGLHKNLLNNILKINPEKLVYVSCNPSTQARDCEILSEKYEVNSIKPVDMFPHTFHLESIALLKRKDKQKFSNS